MGEMVCRGFKSGTKGLAHACGHFPASGTQGWRMAGMLSGFRAGTQTITVITAPKAFNPLVK